MTVAWCALLTGSIPACAGEPARSKPSVTTESRVYPRVCGGALNACTRVRLRKTVGLSPRVRGSRARMHLLSESCQRRVYPRVCGGASVKYLTKVRLSSVFSCQ